MQVELLAERKRSCDQEPGCRQRNLTSGSAGGSEVRAAAGLSAISAIRRTGGRAVVYGTHRAIAHPDLLRIAFFSADDLRCSDKQGPVTKGEVNCGT